MKIKIVVLLALVSMRTLAEIAVSNVEVFSGYPWQEIAVGYTITGTASGERYMVAEVTDNKTAKTYSVLLPDPDLSEGRHTAKFSLDSKISTTDATVSLKITDVAPYLIIDLSAGANATSYPVTYMEALPSGGFNVNAYKTTKLVLRRIEAGSFKMQGSTTTTLTKPFYMGLFEVTQKQWTLVMGSDPCSSSKYGKGDTYPVHYVSYNMIRGSSAGAGWPASSAVDASSFLGKLQAKTGLKFDLPTEAQWEYACRAGTTTTYYWGNSINGCAWYSSNSGSMTHPVGGMMANSWGLYDMSGNVWEWCLDRYGTLSYGTDPKGSSSGSDRVIRGGSWDDAGSLCTSSSRYHCTPSHTSGYHGFRLSRTLP